MPPPSLREAIAPLKREIAERVAENAKLREGGRLLPFRTIEPRQLHDADTLCDAMQTCAALSAFAWTGIADCCARAATGHATAAPPSSVMNSRRLMRTPRQA